MAIRQRPSRIPESLSAPAQMLRSRLRDKSKPDARLGLLKLEMIDLACDLVDARSLADLGGVRAVDGGYSFQAARRPGMKRVVLVDEDFTPEVTDRQTPTGALEFVQGNFGDDRIAGRVGPVDVVLLFDVLFRQVRPDWDEVLDLYAAQTRCFVVVQPTYNAPDAGAVRLVDLSAQRYLDIVPDLAIHVEALEHLDEANVRRGRRWRDVHDIWQWGITGPALERKLAELGFELAHRESRGRWRGLDCFDDCAFVFVRPPAA
ncbi:MAG TPA: hypothetical protein VHW26_01670 [Solirubrobacteraceae bacterium]|nr:hypothetical protein [Solirubrobacteraceae bacterium]